MNPRPLWSLVFALSLTSIDCISPAIALSVSSTMEESMQRILFTETQVEAFGSRCLDGSPSGYYYMPGTDKYSFVIFLEGGGYCADEHSCDGRSKSHLGSSTGWSETVQPPNGLLSSDPDSNVDFHTWNKVYIPYCCGDLHSGTRRTNDVFNLYFSGHLTIEAVISNLRNTTTINEAKQLLLSGGSAGGIGAFEHADFLAAEFPDATVKATPIGGFFFPGNPQNYSAFTSGEPASPRNSSLFDLYKSHVNLNCATANRNRSYLCGPANVGFLYPYIKTPLYIAENRYDTNQIFTQMRCPHVKTKEVEQYVLYYGGMMKKTMDEVIKSRPQAGLYFPTCLQHTGNMRSPYSSRPIDGVTYGQSLGDWYFERSKYPHQLMETATIPDC